MKLRNSVSRSVAILIDLALFASAPALLAKTKTPPPDPLQAQREYISRVQQQEKSAAPPGTMGSLWLADGALVDVNSDYKAHVVGDIVTLLVVEQTSAQSTGDVNSQRTFQTNSAITALPGKLKTGGVNPLFGANSSTALKGQGETDAGSTLNTTLSGHVIALLPNGNMVVEAQRFLLINSQHETMMVRGVLRPGDIGPNNTAPSTALSNLEIELKGKGVVTDSIKQPNPIMRTLLWLIGF